MIHALTAEADISRMFPQICLHSVSARMLFNVTSSLNQTGLIKGDSL